MAASRCRQGPEDVFPAAHDDAYAACVWTVENAGDLNGDAARMAVAGQSAGANLAANFAIAARDAKITPPLHQVLVYPVAGNAMTTPSHIENTEAAPLGKPDMARFVEHAFAALHDAADLLINHVDRNDLSGLPPATLITAQIGPLRSESIACGEALAVAGVAIRAIDFATGNLKAAFRP